MTWEIFISLLSCAAALISIGSIAVKTTKALTQNTEAIRSLKGTQERVERALSDFKNSNKDTHKEFYRRLDDHEHRITILEGGDGK